MEISARTLLSQFDRIHGLVIPGGRDVSPSWYGKRPHPQTQVADLDRDSLEMALIRRALEKDIPVLGICRGHQLLNVTLGGTLHQHIQHHNGNTHSVQINERSRHLGYLYHDDEPFMVNSLHHQSIAELGKDLRPIAVAYDGTVEAVESLKHNFVLGVQWHPEMYVRPKFHEEMQYVMHRFVKAR